MALTRKVGDVDLGASSTLNGAPFGGGGTLDQAYDFGGAGAGRTIVADTGAVQINKTSVDTNTGLFVNVTAGTGPSAVFSGSTTTQATIYVGSGVTSATPIAATIAGTSATGGSNASGSTVTVRGGAADGTGGGGPVVINGGNSADAVGAASAGAVSLVTQNTGAFTHPIDSGAILLTTGDSNQTSGVITLKTGARTGGGAVGDITLQTGTVIENGQGNLFVASGNNMQFDLAQNPSSGAANFIVNTGNFNGEAGAGQVALNVGQVFLNTSGGGQGSTSSFNDSILIGPTNEAAGSGTGFVTMRSGDAANGNSGGVTIRSGDTTGAFQSGDVSITVGAFTGGATSGALNVGTVGGNIVNIGFTGSNIGFLGTAAVGKQTVTGSRAGNAALASFLTALANFGFITDSTSA